MTGGKENFTLITVNSKKTIIKALASGQKMEKRKGKREKRISNIEQGISNNEGKKRKEVQNEDVSR
jgi:hypothetical protein